MNALLVLGSGINVVGGSASFVGVAGQTSFTSGVNLDADASFQPAGTFAIGDGLLLTSGSGNPPLTNRYVLEFQRWGGPGSAIFNGLCNQCNDTENANILSFNFTADPGITSVRLDFIFGSDEFPDQGVSDIAPVIVDGTNFAFFQDGDPLTFEVASINEDYFEDYFNNNFGGPLNLDVEYDGVTGTLLLVGILDAALATHTVQIGSLTPSTRSSTLGSLLPTSGAARTRMAASVEGEEHRFRCRVPCSSWAPASRLCNRPVNPTFTPRPSGPKMIAMITFSEVTHGDSSCCPGLVPPAAPARVLAGAG